MVPRPPSGDSVEGAVSFPLLLLRLPGFQERTSLPYLVVVLGEEAQEAGIF